MFLGELLLKYKHRRLIPLNTYQRHTLPKRKVPWAPRATTNFMSSSLIPQSLVEDLSHRLSQVFANIFRREAFVQARVLKHLLSRGSLPVQSVRTSPLTRSSVRSRLRCLVMRVLMSPVGRHRALEPATQVTLAFHNRRNSPVIIRRRRIHILPTPGSTILGSQSRSIREIFQASRVLGHNCFVELRFFFYVFNVDTS